MSTRETHQRDKARRIVEAKKVGEIETSLPRVTSPLWTKGKARTPMHPESIHVSYATDHTGSLSKKGKLAAIVQKEEEQEDNKIASLKLLN